VGLVNHTHSAATKLLKDSVMQDGRPDHDDLLSGRRTAATAGASAVLKKEQTSLQNYCGSESKAIDA
jgi:hypothetical protein